MLIFGRDCGCDERRAYMTDNPVAFLVLAGIVLVGILVAVKGVPFGGA